MNLASLVATGRKDLELARALCAETGRAAPRLDQAIETLDARGAEALRADLASILS